MKDVFTVKDPYAEAARLARALPAPSVKGRPQYANSQEHAVTRLRIAALGRATYARSGRGSVHGPLLESETRDLVAAADIVDSAPGLDAGIDRLLALKASIATVVDGRPFRSLDPVLGSGNTARLAAEIAAGNMDAMFGVLPSWFCGPEMGLLDLDDHRFDDPALPHYPLAMGGFE